MGTLGFLSLLATLALAVMGITMGGWRRRAVVIALAAIAFLGSLQIQRSSEKTISQLARKLDDAREEVRDSRQAMEKAQEYQKGQLSVLAQLSARTLDAISPKKPGEDVAALQSALAELRAQLSAFQPRHLTPEQIEALAAGLSALHLSMHVDVTSVLGDGEAFSYAEDFIRAFRSVGWNSEHAQGVFAQTPVGLGVAVGPDNPHLEHIVAAFNAAHVQGNAFTDAQLTDPSAMRVVVGTKPQAKP